MSEYEKFKHIVDRKDCRRASFIAAFIRLPLWFASIAYAFSDWHTSLALSAALFVSYFNEAYSNVYVKKEDK